MKDVRRLFPKLVLIAGCLGLSYCSPKKDHLAEVGGRSITQKEFETYLKLKKINKEDQQVYQEALKEYLEREALATSIEKTAVIDAALLEAEVQEFRKQALISRYFEKYLDEQVNDVAIQNYYNANAAEFESKQAHISHILIRTRPRMSDNEVKAKHTQAMDLYGRLKQGAKLQDLAKKFSEDKVSASKGGDLGWSQEGIISKEFSDQVFAMPVGSYSEPIRTPFGFHIVYLHEEPKTIKKPFDSVKGDIRYKLRQKTKASQMKKLLADTKLMTHHTGH